MQGCTQTRKGVMSNRGMSEYWDFAARLRSRPDTKRKATADPSTRPSRQSATAFAQDDKV